MGEKPVPVCKDCGQPMIEIGKLAKDSPTHDMGMAFFAEPRTIVLYQCPEDKTIALV